MTTTTARTMIMSDEETEAMLRTIQDCSEHTQCGVDDVSALLDELRSQETVLSARLAYLDQLVQDLKATTQPHASKKGGSTTSDDKDAVRALVRDLLRVFSTQGAPAFPVSGFAGDIGQGPMTAYDALPPKKWKPQQEH